MTAPIIKSDAAIVAEALAELRGVDFSDDGLGGAIAAAAAAPPPRGARRVSPALTLVLAETQAQDAELAEVAAGIWTGMDALEEWVATIDAIQRSGAHEVNAQGHNSGVATPTGEVGKHAGGGGSW